MTIIFNATKLPSITSSLYQVEAIDETGAVLMNWQVVINEGDDIQVIANEGYQQAIAMLVVR